MQKSVYFCQDVVYNNLSSETKVKMMIDSKTLKNVSSSAVRNALGIQDLTFEQVATETNALPKSNALLQETENTYVILGELGEMVKRFYKISNWGAACKLLEKMILLSIASGTPQAVAYEWAEYQVIRWTKSH